MLLEWCLILAVTGVSTTMLMVIGAYITVLSQAETYYAASQTQILLFANLFNILHLVITPFIFHKMNIHYIYYVVVSSAGTGVAVFGRYLSFDDYYLCLFFTFIVGVCHIPIITAPYGLLKLFPDSKKGYAASIPLFVPALGINFCIFYGMQNILQNANSKQGIEGLNLIIAVVGGISCLSTILLLYKLKDKIQSNEQKTNQQTVNTLQISQIQGKTSDQDNIDKQIKIVKDPTITQTVQQLCQDSRIVKMMVAWGTILGVSWTYGAMFSVIFKGHSLSNKQIATIGLAANLSSAIFSNLGTFLKNNVYNNSRNMIIILNCVGLGAAFLIIFSKMLELQVVAIIILIILLRIGFSSFVSLALQELQKTNISPILTSNFFFWVANFVNLVTQELQDFYGSLLGQIVMIFLVVAAIMFDQKIMG